MTIRPLLFLLSLTVILVGCDDDDEGMMACDVSAGTIAGGPFAFTIDGLPDAVEGITLDGASGALMTYVITDADGVILGIEPSASDLQAVDFDANGAGTCFIYHMSFQRGVVGADVGSNIADVTGCYELSNAIEVARAPCGAVAGTLDSTAFEFAIDEEADFIASEDIQLAGAEGDTVNYVVTSADSVIVSVVPDLDALAAIDFNDFSAGGYLVWALSRNGDLDGAAPGTFATGVAGCYELSNPLSVTVGCPADGGTLTGGPFVFRIDGEGDFLAEGDLSLEGASGDTTTYVVTDGDGVILALPSDSTALREVNFDDAGIGQCLIWHLSYNGPIGGAAVGENANALTGCFDLSNAIIVQRVCTASGGRLSGGPFSIVVDSLPDTAASLPADTIDTRLLVLSAEQGENFTYVVTDADGEIVALPGDLEALGDVNFDSTGGGTRLIWHLAYDGEISGAEVGANAMDIGGCWDLSNSIAVTRSTP